MEKFKKEKSFTLLEMIFAIFFLTVVFLSVFSLITQLIIGSSISSQNLIAAYLAQEGMELVRNIRDTNLLEGKDWREGLGEGEWQIDFNDSNLLPYNGDFLKINDEGFYHYGGGRESPYKRKITISQSEPDVLKVEVQVFWQERGREHQLKAEGRLYNWR